MTTLELECPVALEQHGGKHMEINGDAIPLEVIGHLNTFVSSKIGNRSLLDAPQK